MGAIAGIAALTVSAYSAYDANQQGRANRKLSRKQQLSADKIAQRQLELSEEQWASYQDNVLPLEMEAQRLGIDAQTLAQQRGEREFQIYNDFYAPLQESFAKDAEKGIEGQYLRVARDAGGQVDKEFARAKDITERSLERKGVRPDAGNYKANEQQMGFSLAANRANSMNLARENEFNRVEDTNFNRKAVALGRMPTGAQATQSPARPQIGPASSNLLMNNAASGYRGSANMYNNAANQNYRSGAAALSGGITAAANIYSAFKPSSPPPSVGGGGGMVQGSLGSDYTGNTFKYEDGGPVLSRDNPGGEVNGPGGNDQVQAKIESPDGNDYDARLTDGEYVIPLQVVMAKGTDFFDKLLEQHGNNSTKEKALARRSN